MIPAVTLSPSQQAIFDEMREFAHGADPDHMQVALLAGSAGTGKTTVVAELVRMLVGEGLNVAVAAPTHKALRVLRSKIPTEAVEFATIHSLTGLALDEHDDGSTAANQKGRSKLDQFDIALIDECSMIGVSLYKHILQCRHGCLLIFIGDPAQLPPVKDGAESPVFTTVERRWTLTEIVRQAAGNPMIALGTAIRRANESQTRMDIDRIAATIPPGSTQANIWHTTRQYVAAAVADDWRAGVDSRVVAYRNRTVVEHGMAVHRLLHPTAPHRFTAGEIVIAQEGSQRPEIATNEELTVLEVEAVEHPKFPDVPALAVVLQRPGGVEKLRGYTVTHESIMDRLVENGFQEARRLKAQGQLTESRRKAAQTWALKRGFLHLRHAYAMTAHKSQGSTFHTAYLDLNDVACMPDTLEYNRCLYVGCTRPSQNLAIVVA